MEMNNPFKKYKVDTLLIGSISILFVIMIFLTIWISYTLSSKEMAQIISVNQQRLLDELNNEITSRLASIEQISLSAARDNKLLSYLSDPAMSDGFTRFQRFKEVQQSLANMTNSIPMIQGMELFMVDPLYGDIQSSTQFRPLGDAVGQRWYELIRRSDSAWIEGVVTHALHGKIPVLSFARPVQYNNRRFGYLVIHVKADSLRSMLSGHTPGASRMMLDASGNPVLSIGNVPTPEQWPSWKEGMTEASGFFRVHPARGDSGPLLVYSRTNKSDWIMVELTPWSQITAGSLRMAAAIGAIGAAAIVLSVLFTFYISKQFTRPIKQLVTAMNRYTVEGNNENLPADYENEFGYLFSGYRKQNERIEELIQSLRLRHEEQRKAEIEALQANINPHFLYNTLDQLNWLAIMEGQEKISRILELIGRMFRIGLSKGESFITIEEELEHLSSYVQIQQLRGSLELEYEVYAPEELKRHYMPKMTLQPFVENSVIHGFHLLESGRVMVSMEAQGDKVLIRIEDNGIGLREEGQDHVRKNKGGYGIKNVRERIHAYFGETYGVTITNREEGGTKVEILLPLLESRPGTT